MPELYLNMSLIIENIPGTLKKLMFLVDTGVGEGPDSLISDSIMNDSVDHNCSIK